MVYNFGTLRNYWTVRSDSRGRTYSGLIGLTKSNVSTVEHRNGGVGIACHSIPSSPELVFIVLALTIK